MNSNRNFLMMMISLISVQGFLIWATGNVYVNAHELDVLHALEGALRVADGERPHLDFMTPLGVLTFAPPAILLNLGFGRGAAIAFSGIFIAIMALPALYWVGSSRLSGRLRWVWGASLILLITASIFGETAGNNSFSMYYNRWSWAVAFIVMSAVALPSENRKSDNIDALVIGSGMAFLALCKMTFFAGFFPGILLALLYKRKWRVLLIGGLVGLAVMALVTVWAGGVSYWIEYINDLRFVQSVNLGERNGGWSGYIASPTGTFAVVSIIVAAVFLSKSDNQDMALSVLFFAPGFIFVTFNNWGVEPKYLVFLALLIWVGAQKNTLAAAGFALLLIGSLAPTLLNIALSNLRPFAFNKGAYEAVFTGEGAGALMFKSERIHIPKTAMGFPETPYQISTVDGDTHTLPECTISQGNLGQDRSIMDLLTSLELESEGVLVADAFSSYWMFGDFKRLKGAAIWQYGGDYGAADAGILVVADCPSSPIRRKTILDGIKDAGYGLSLIEEGERASIYRLIK